MKWIAALFTALCLATTAWSQSTVNCKIPDVASTFQKFRDANQPFVVVRGSARFDSSQIPKNRSKTFSIAGKFSGKSLGLFGFNKPFDEPVAFRFDCTPISPENDPDDFTCGSLKPETEILAFLEKSDKGYTLVTHLCSQTVFTRYLDEHSKMARKCFLGLGCSPHYF